jgi:hypothetical protein
MYFDRRVFIFVLRLCVVYMDAVFFVSRLCVVYMDAFLLWRLCVEYMDAVLFCMAFTCRVHGRGFFLFSCND